MRATLPPPRRAALAVLVVAAVLLAVAGNAHRSAAASVPVYHDDDDDDWAADAGYGYGGVVACAGTAVGAECAVASRRELGGGGYIGYGALQKDQVPCSQRGAPYGNCGPGGAANPYTRGCLPNTQCRG